jgi:hypothetical protein
MKKCKFCNFNNSESNEMHRDDFGSFELNYYKKNEYHEEKCSIEARYDYGECEMDINYCPICGRQLNKKKGE